VSGDLENRLRAVERRLLAVEDELAILRLIASYGPAVDTGDGAAVSRLWAEEGSYEVGGMTPFVGADEVGRLVEIDEHQGYIQQGCAHVLSLPRITLRGDLASAVNYSRLYRHDGRTWFVARVSANYWSLAREDRGWVVVDRRNRLLNGDAAARALLRT
jgi:hypothetical protein